jgi:hypothetical protein
MILKSFPKQNASVVVEVVKLKRDAEKIVKNNPALNYRKVTK